MLQRQEKLESILKLVSDIRCVTEIPRPKLNDICSSGLHKEVMAVYRELGGCQQEIPMKPGPWDINVSGIAVELDEYLHFNRYRNITLNSPLYFNLDHFPLEAYREYCSDHETDCLKAGSYGGKWTNSSCERQFGESSFRGNLSGAGAPRWKQRAFYDFIKDIAPLTSGVRMARISIWDNVVLDNRPSLVSEILDKELHSAAEPILAMIQERSSDTLRM